MPGPCRRQKKTYSGEQIIINNNISHTRSLAAVTTCWCWRCRRHCLETRVWLWTDALEPRADDTKPVQPSARVLNFGFRRRHYGGRPTRTSAPPSSQRLISGSAAPSSNLGRCYIGSSYLGGGHVPAMGDVLPRIKAARHAAVFQRQSAGQPRRQHGAGSVRDWPSVSGEAAVQ